MNTAFKKSTSRLLIGLLAFSALSISGSFAAEKTYKVGDRFTEKGIAAGKNPVVLQILNADLNKDGQSDLFLSAPTGGSGGFVSYDLSTLKNGKLVSYLTQADLKGLTLEAEFLDNYQVAVTAKEINKTWTLDVSHNAKMYQETKVYAQKRQVHRHRNAIFRTHQLCRNSGPIQRPYA